MKKQLLPLAAIIALVVCMCTTPAHAAAQPRVDLGIITVRTLAQAKKIRKMLLKGKSFEELARKYSVGPAAARGGRLGLVPVSKLREEYRQAIKDLPPGKPSQPVPTEEGYTILMLFHRPSPAAATGQQLQIPAQLLARRKVMAALEAMASGAWTKAQKLLSEAKAYNPHESTITLLSPVVAWAKSSRSLAKAARHMALGLIALMDTRVDDALKELKKAAGIAPEECTIRFVLAQALAAAGKRQQATKILKSLASSPCKARAMSLLGVIELEAGHIKQAERLLTQAMKADPSLAQAPYYLGLIAGAKGQRTKAIALLKKALSADPYMEEACNELGVLYMHEGNLREAARWLRKALSLRPDYPEAQVNLGNCYARARRFRRAIDEYEKALALRPGMPQALVNLAAAYAELKQWDKATDYARQALAQGFKLPPALARKLAPHMSTQP